MTDATELDEAAVRARVEAATEGPWRAAEQTHGNWCGIQSEWHALGTAYHPADAEFIAHARADLPAALDEITRLRAALDEARAEVERREGMFRRCLESENRAQADLAVAESALASIRTLARSWSGRHDLLMTGGSAAHDIETALATPTNTERSESDD